MTKRKHSRPARPRRTVPLTGTSKSTPAHLHFDAELALLYAGAYLFRAGGVRVPASGIVRAALVAYAARLDGIDEATSFRDARSACMGRPVTLDQRQAAELRLYSVPADESFPRFGVVLRGHGAADAAAELTARAGALADALIAAQQPRQVAA